MVGLYGPNAHVGVGSLIGTSRFTADIVGVQGCVNCGRLKGSALLLAYGIVARGEGGRFLFTPGILAESFPVLLVGLLHSCTSHSRVP